MKLTLRQRLLKLVYPLLVMYRRQTGSNQKLNKLQNGDPPVSFYSLSAELNNGQRLSFVKLSGKKVLIVNTASNCGYTAQYSELQKLYEQSKEKLVMIGFPSNDFKEQEKSSDEEIAQFCKLNFGINFPLAKKSVVRKKVQQNGVFKWLTHKELNGWNDKEPSWNFSKYLVNEEGILIHYFDPAVSPLSQEVILAVRQ